MKISHKLVLGFWILTACVWITGYFSYTTSKKELKRTLIDHDVLVATNLIQHINSKISARVETFQEYAHDVLLRNGIEEANHSFNKLPNIQRHIDNINNQWTSQHNSTNNTVLNDILSNEVSEELLEKQEYYQEKYGYPVFSEVFVTNKYGAVAGATNATTDYRQDDEEWWQLAKTNGHYVSDISYDDSGNYYGLNICVRIEDENKKFLGVLKAVYNIQELTNILQLSKKDERHSIHGYMVFTKDGKIIYSSAHEVPFLQDASQHKIFQNITGGNGYFFAPGYGHHGDSENFFTYARAQTNPDFHGCNWTILIGHDPKEAFRPIDILKNRILMISSVVGLFSLLFSLFIFRSISTPLTNLKDSITALRKGKIGGQTDIGSTDEIGQIAKEFNALSSDLKETTVSKELLIKEINERMILEKKIEEKEQFLEDILNSIQDGITVLDHNMNIVKANHTMSNWYGNGNSLQGLKCFQAYHDKSEPCADCPSMKAFSSGEMQQKEIPLCRNDKDKGTLEVFAFPMKNDRNEVISVVEYIRDISERKEMEEALQNSEMQLLNILNSVLTGIIIIDAETQEIIDANPSAISMMDTTRERFLGQKCYDHMCPAEKGKCPIIDLGNERDHSERVLVDANGKKIPVIKSVSRQTINGRPCLIESFVNISERKEAEQEREKLIGKLQKALEEIKTLSGIIPICASCKKIRDDKGYWSQVENYIEQHSSAQFSHAMCEECCEKAYGGQDWYEEAKKDGEISISTDENNKT
jgi:PAS domain S-box-containing protein